MAHMEPMDVDSISNDFDDKENSLQNSNVLSRTPSTEKGYEELDVSELNMKLRYSMTPASSPMSRSFTTNCRDNKLCDNENNAINSMFNDNANLTHSFNSTITDSILKSPKFPLQVLPTEQFVDDNGNPIARSLDVKCNNVTITLGETGNIDDNLSLPSTSSSLVHTPEATTPTKDILKDGGSPIMRGLKSVLNMFRTSQSPVPADDIATRDVKPFESQQKEEPSKFNTNIASTPTTTTKNKEMTLKTNSPLKESLVFNEDLEKELLWEDETTILFKEEKIPIHKLFFPLNSTFLEKTDPKPTAKRNMNTTVEYMDVSFNQTAIADKTMTDIEKFSSQESETINSPESDSEFVDCETSYTKNDTRTLDDNIPVLLTTTNNTSLKFSIHDENTFQSNEIVAEEISLPVVSMTELASETHEIISNIDDGIKEGDIDNCKQSCHNDLLIMRKSLGEMNILPNSLKEDIPNNLAEQGNAGYETVNELLQCSNETFNFEKYSKTNDTYINPEHNNDLVNASNIIDNSESLCEEKNEDFKGCYPSQITKEIENNTSGELICNLDSTVIFNEPTLKNSTDILKINNITLPLKSQVDNEVEIDLGVVQDEIITKNNTDITLAKCENVMNNECNVILGNKKIDDTITNHNETDAFTFPGLICQVDDKEIKTVNNNLPSDIPLPYDSDIDKENLQHDNEGYFKENDKSVNISSNNIKSSTSIEPIKETIDMMTSLAETHSKNTSNLEINNTVLGTSIIQTSQLAVCEDMSKIQNNIRVNESEILKTEIFDTIKCISTVLGDVNDVSSNIIDKVILPSNNNCSVSGINPHVSTLHTQDIQNLNSENQDECVQISENTVKDENINIIDVKMQYDELSLSLSKNKTPLTGMELDVPKHDSRDISFERKNNLEDSPESQCRVNIMEDVILENYVENVPIVADNKNEIRNDIDVLEKYDETDTNTSVIGMDLNVSKHDSEDSKNAIESKDINLLKIPGRDNHANGATGTKYIDSFSTILNDKNKIIMKTEGKIIEEVNLSSFSNNSLVTEMELDVSKRDLVDIGNQMETKQQIVSSSEEQGCESVIEHLNTKKYPENKPLVHNDEITRGKNLNINEVINIPSNNNSVIQMELDELNHDLRASENQIKPLCCDTDIEVFDIEKTDFESRHRLSDEGVEITSNETISDEFILPITKDIPTEIDLGVLKYIKENIENTSETTTLIPSSPPISSKFTQNGYNINFDEIDDPFTTKTNIRMSPTSSIGKDDFSNTESTKVKTKTELQKRPQLNRRKTLHDRKKTNFAKQNANASFDCVLKGDKSVNKCEDNLKIQEIYVKHSEKKDDIEKNINSVTSDNLQEDIELNNPKNFTFLEQTENLVEDAEMHLSDKISSSSGEIYKSKNVFNLPEIDDMNFNPFATKSKIHQSPTKETENFLFDKSKINENENSSEVCCYPLEQTAIESCSTESEKNNEQDLKPNLCSNLSNETCSSNNAGDITTVREVHTEDEDTVEGPFLEADDFADIVKVTDFGTEKDMMNFEDFPPQIEDDNKNGEFFIDAEAFEFLLNQNKSNVVADSGKESLFLKFDPLFAKRVSSDGMLAALNKIQKRQSTPKKLTPLRIMHEESPTPGPSTTTPIDIAAPVATDIVEDEPVAAIAKPMMVVNPAVASIVSPRKSTTPPRINRRSLTFTSPAMAVIDRLLSLSGNNSRLDQDTSLSPRREYNETDIALTQLRELLAEKEIHVHNLRSESKELKERLAILESQVRSLETESEERLRKVKDLNEHLEEKNKINKSMAIVVEEYERTIASLIAEMEQEKKQNAEERMKLISERDEQTAHLASMEVSFSDLHSKYEKSKQIILSMKANEDTYKKSLNEFEVNLLKMQTNYDLLKQHATSKLNHANQELEKYNRAHDAEVVKLNAMIKRKELHITSLEESLLQKTKANEELTAICDELINKVG